MAELIPYMFADLGAPLAPVLFATDAQGGEGADAGGFGIVASNVGVDSVQQVLAVGMRPGFSVTKLSGEYTGRRRPEEPWRRRAPYSLLGSGLIEGAVWHPVAAGRWSYADYIALGEGRAVVKLVRGLASCPAAHGHKAASLQDNTAVSGSFSKAAQLRQP